MYKKQQASRMVQLFMSGDPGVRKAADLQLEDEREKQQSKFKPAMFVDDLRIDRAQTRRALSGAVKTLLAEEEADQNHLHLCQLSSQREMARAWGESSPQLWVKAVQSLPPEVMKFAINASSNTLPTNANLHLWGKKNSDVCRLCQEARRSLSHVLNNCQVAMELRRYSKRHDEVLKVIGAFIRANLPPHFALTIDHPSATYSFPHHITPTDLRPDIVWWCDSQKELWLFELTISYETAVADARLGKTTKYQDLVDSGRAAGFKTTLITLEVGSRGMLAVSDFYSIRAATHTSLKAVTGLCLQVIRSTLLESFQIWTSRNSTT